MLALAFLALLAAAFAPTATESAAHHGLLTLTIAEIRHLITMMIIKLLRDTAYLLWWSARDEPTKLAPATSTTNDQPEPVRSQSVGGVLTGLLPSPTRHALVGFRFSGRLPHGPVVQYR